MEKKRLAPIAITIGLMGVVIAWGIAGLFFARQSYKTEKTASTSSALSTVESLDSASQNLSPVPSGNRITMTGDDADTAQLDAYVKRIYELKYLYGITQFSKAAELPVSAAVQYAFCYVFNDSLLDMPTSSKMVYREASKQDIQQKLTMLFGPKSASIKIENSDLYNADKGIFEMWEPKYDQTVYASAVSTKTQDGYALTIQFYGDAAHSVLKGTAQATLKSNADQSCYIEAMQ